jgi:hypothetical protein
MAESRITGYVLKTAVGIISLYIVIYLLNFLFTSPAPLEPEDPLYSSQEIINGLNTALPLLAAGTIGAIALILLKDSY